MKRLLGWKLVYDNATDAEIAAAAAAAVATAAAATAGGGGDPKTLTLTQDQLNKMMADNRRKLAQQNQQLAQELETLREQSNLTTQQREELEARINQLQEQYMTKEEIAKKEQVKLVKLAEGEKIQLKSEVESWRLRYSTATVQRSLTDAAVEGKAVSPEQLVAILGTTTSLQPVIGDDGKPTGDYAPVVKFHDVDSNGKPIVLDLSPQQAVKRMRELPQKFGNLFQSDATAGLGLHSGSDAGTGGSPPVSALKDLDAYAKWRSTHPDLNLPASSR